MQVILDDFRIILESWWIMMNLGFRSLAADMMISTCSSMISTAIPKRHPLKRRASAATEPSSGKGRPLRRAREATGFWSFDWGAGPLVVSHHKPLLNLLGMVELWTTIQVLDGLKKSTTLRCSRFKKQRFLKVAQPIGINRIKHLLMASTSHHQPVCTDGHENQPTSSGAALA